MATCEIGDVDEVTHGGSIGGGPVGAEHGEMWGLAGHDFDDDGKEIGGDTLRVFSQEAGRVAADGIEVAEGEDGPVWVGVGEVGENGLAHPFGAAVGVGDSSAALLDDLVGGAGEELRAVHAVFFL